MNKNASMVKRGCFKSTATTNALLVAVIASMWAAVGLISYETHQIRLQSGPVLSRMISRADVQFDRSDELARVMRSINSTIPPDGPARLMHQILSTAENTHQLSASAKTLLSGETPELIARLARETAQMVRDITNAAGHFDPEQTGKTMADLGAVAEWTRSVSELLTPSHVPDLVDAGTSALREIVSTSQELRANDVVSKLDSVLATTDRLEKRFEHHPQITVGLPLENDEADE